MLILQLLTLLLLILLLLILRSDLIAKCAIGELGLKDAIVGVVLAEELLLLYEPLLQ